MFPPRGSSLPPIWTGCYGTCWWYGNSQKHSEAAFGVFLDHIEWHHDVHSLHVLHLRRFRTRRTTKGLLHCWSFHWNTCTLKTCIKSGKITLHGMNLNSVLWWFGRLDAWLLKKGCWLKWKLTPTPTPLIVYFYVLTVAKMCGKSMRKWHTHTQIVFSSTQKTKQVNYSESPLVLHAHLTVKMCAI